MDQAEHDDPITTRTRDTMNIRRDALIERKDAITATLRTNIADTAADTDKPGLLQAVEVGNLLLDILIDLAHPER